MTDFETGAHLLHRLRRERGMSQQRLADVSGVSVRTVRGLESARVRSPHLSSVRALAGGLDLDLERTKQLVAAWPSSSPPVDWAELTGHGDATALIEEAGRVSRLALTAAVTMRMVVDDRRRMDHQEIEMLVRARADGARHALWVSDSDDALDVADIEVDDVVGGRVAVQRISPEAELAVLVFEFPSALAEGEYHAVRFRLAAGDQHRATSSRGRVLGPASSLGLGHPGSMSLLRLETRFVGVLPAHVFCLGGLDKVERGQRLYPNRDGWVMRVVENVEPGNHGIGWTWD